MRHVLLWLLPLGSRRRWDLAYRLDRRDASYCWSDLVVWVMYGPVGRDDGDLRSCKRACPIELLGCYCGKRGA